MAKLGSNCADLILLLDAVRKRVKLEKEQKLGAKRALKKVIEVLKLDESD